MCQGSVQLANVFAWNNKDNISEYLQRLFEIRKMQQQIFLYKFVDEKEEFILFHTKLITNTDFDFIYFKVSLQMPTIFQLISETNLLALHNIALNDLPTNIPITYNHKYLVYNPCCKFNPNWKKILSDKTYRTQFAKILDMQFISTYICSFVFLKINQKKKKMYRFEEFKYEKLNKKYEWKFRKIIKSIISR